MISISSGAPEGFSGAPGESNCSACHSSFPLNSGDGELTLSSNIPASGYIPGETYEIQVSVSQKDRPRFGFQLSSQSEASATSIGTFELTDSIRTQIKTLTLATTSTYITHTKDGIESPDENEWEVNWTAPDSGTGKVIFYVASVAANKDSSNQGDYVYTAQLGIEEVENVPAPSDSVKIQVKVLLEGYLANGDVLMRTALVENDLLPLDQPFNSPPFNYNGVEQLIQDKANIVDWVFVELRDKDDPASIITQKAAFVSPDGMIRDAEHEDLLAFDELEEGEYYIAVYHRNHMAVMSNVPVLLSATTPALFDFTEDESRASGRDQLERVNDVYVMYSGDFDQNGLVNNLDFNAWAIDAATIDAYISVDADGNGLVNNLDFNFWSKRKSRIGLPVLQK